MKKSLIIWSFLFWAYPADAQQNTEELKDFLYSRIAIQQTKKDRFFLPGIYPSYINNKKVYAEKKKDLTIFYNALIDQTLRQMHAKAPPAAQKKIEALQAGSKNLYPRFKNQKGRNTYNFWLRDSVYTFPYSWWIPLIKKDPNVPDDMDDTSLALLALSSSQDSVKLVHALIGEFVNKKNNPLRTAAKRYRGEPAYSTWFGKKFPVVFDISVLANTLFLVQSYDLAWTGADSASLRVILEAIDTRDYSRNSMLISPYYGKPSIILYHLARLMSVKEIPALEARKPALVAAAGGFYLTSQNVVEKIILSSALKKWGVQTGFDQEILQRFSADKNFIEKEIERSNFPFFIGNIPSYFSFGIKKVFTSLNALIYYHYCPAYNDVLLLEYLTD